MISNSSRETGADESEGILLGFLSGEELAVLGFSLLSGLGLGLPGFVLGGPLGRVLDVTRVDRGGKDLVGALVVPFFDKRGGADLQKVVSEIAANLKTFKIGCKTSELQTKISV